MEKLHVVADCKIHDQTVVPGRRVTSVISEYHFMQIHKHRKKPQVEDVQFKLFGLFFVRYRQTLV